MKEFVIEDSIEIKTTPEKIWDFFIYCEENYKIWHPQDHIKFLWVKVKPLEMGSMGYFEEYMHGRVHKMTVEYTRIVPYQEIEYKIVPKFWRRFYPYNLMKMEPKGDLCAFNAITIFRLPPISAHSKRARKQIELAKKHVKEEGENLKQILEKESTPRIQ